MSSSDDASVEFMDAFFLSMDRYFLPLMLDKDVRAVAVGVSGGADSLALCFALSEYFVSEHFAGNIGAEKSVELHAITVDHRLRPEAGDEAIYVRDMLRGLPNVRHVTLEWEHDERPQVRIQEQARHARYDLMRGYMRGHGMSHLFLGHHLDDQAETFLFRLAKGSGLDGLGGMSFVQNMDHGLVLSRPFLDMPKADIVSFCDDRGIDYIDDPSNEDERYARVRLRQSMDVLSAEGLTSKRLGVCAKRMMRAREALDGMAENVFSNAVLEIYPDRIVFNFKILKNIYEEVFLRVILKAIDHFNPHRDYSVRMAKAERLCLDLQNAIQPAKRSLGGVLFMLDLEADILEMVAES